MEELQYDNMRKMTIDVVKLSKAINLLTLLILVVAIAPFCFIWPHGGHALKSVFTSLTSIILLTVAVIVGLAVHELIHGITWACFSENGFRSISFGINPKQFMIYCHCSDPLKIKHYVIGALMPCFLLGVVPVIVAYIIGHAAMLIFGALFIVLALGDILIVWTIRHESPDCKVLDHPKEPGCYIID